jgi:hypothetical protein
MSDLTEGRTPASEPAPARDTRGGRVAYETYSAAVGGVSVRGDQLWTWDEMREKNPKVAEAWNLAARAVITAYTSNA